MRQETIKTLEEKAGKDLSDLSRSNLLLDTSPKARELKAKMNYWDLMKIKSFCTTKETTNKTKLKIDKGPECETGNHQNSRGESRKRPLSPQL